MQNKRATYSSNIVRKPQNLKEQYSTSNIIIIRKGQIFSNLCGLLKIPELYLSWHKFQANWNNPRALIISNTYHNFSGLTQLAWSLSYVIFRFLPFKFWTISLKCLWLQLDFGKSIYPCKFLHSIYPRNSVNHFHTQVGSKR